MNYFIELRFYNLGAKFCDQTQIKFEIPLLDSSCNILRCWHFIYTIFQFVKLSLCICMEIERKNLRYLLKIYVVLYNIMMNKMWYCILLFHFIFRRTFVHKLDSFINMMTEDYIQHIILVSQNSTQMISIIFHLEPYKKGTIIFLCIISCLLKSCYINE